MTKTPIRGAERVLDTGIEGSVAAMLAGFIRVAEKINDVTGKATAWLTLACVLTCFTVVFLRYGFSISYVWMQDMYVWLHALVFMLGAGYTYLIGGHVRVDLFYGTMTARRRAMVDMFGVAFFLTPWAYVVLWSSYPFVMRSWSILEPSTQPSGLDGVFLFKTVIPLTVILITLHGWSVAARGILVLRGHKEFEVPYGGH